MVSKKLVCEDPQEESPEGQMTARSWRARTGCLSAAPCPQQWQTSLIEHLALPGWLQMSPTAASPVAFQKATLWLELLCQIPLSPFLT